MYVKLIEEQTQTADKVKISKLGNDTLVYFKKGEVSFIGKLFFDEQKQTTMGGITATKNGKIKQLFGKIIESELVLYDNFKEILSFSLDRERRIKEPMMSFLYGFDNTGTQYLGTIKPQKKGKSERQLIKVDKIGSEYQPSIIDYTLDQEHEKMTMKGNIIRFSEREEEKTGTLYKAGWTPDQPERERKEDDEQDDPISWS